MLSDDVTPYISTEMISTLTRLFICFCSLVLLFALNCIERSRFLKDIKDDPDSSFFDKELAEFTKSQTKYISSEIRAEKFKGAVGIILSLLGIFILMTMVNEFSAEYAAFVFASFAVVALTVRALFLSVGCVLQTQSYKQAELEKGQKGAAKPLIELNNKYLARTVSITVAGALLSAYLLYHVNPTL